MPQNTKFHKSCFSTFCLLTLILFSSPSYASLVTGTDWNGMDLIPGNGDVLSGVFTNVRSFKINTGDIVNFSPQLDVFANSISIYGYLDSLATSGSTLSLNSITTIYLDSAGQINMFGNGNSLNLTAQTLVLNGSINPQADPPASTAPLPSSAILFGSALAGFGLLRKKTPSPISLHRLA